MAETLVQIEKDFLKYVEKIVAYNEAIAVMAWDLRTGAPKKGVEQRSKVIGLLSAEVFKLSTSSEMKYFLDALLSEEGRKELSEITIKTAEDCKKNFDRMNKIPAEEYEEFVILQSKSESVWEDAKKKAEFSIFQPYLEKLVEKTNRFIKYWDWEGNPYNALLDLYEPGMTVEVLNPVFNEVRKGIIPLLEKIERHGKKVDTSFLLHPFPKEAQRELCIEILNQMGYDFEAGRLDETVHPFETALNPGDVRVTTNYNINDFRVALFGTIHEGGHALYEQNISTDLVGTTLAGGASMGIHESQSLFNENMIGRSRAFWKRNYSLLKQYSSGQFEHVDLEDFYRAINEVKPSLIRIEADELTYPLHIIVRYELEKGIFNEEIAVKDLPAIWNEKYKEYLGITPDHDGVGVLQDIHWAGGSFGYFPSYALGIIYAAQMRNALLKEMPNFDELIEKGELDKIRQWFTEKVHRFGKLKKPLEILHDATGEGLNPKYLLTYLEEKYTEIYQL